MTSRKIFHLKIKSWLCSSINTVWKNVKILNEKTFRQFKSFVICVVKTLRNFSPKSERLDYLNSHNFYVHCVIEKLAESYQFHRKLNWRIFSRMNEFSVFPYFALFLDLRPALLISTHACTVVNRFHEMCHSNETSYL